MSGVSDIRFYFFHNCAYNVIPEHEQRFHSTWVDYPNTEFDPEVGHELYQRHLRLIRMADELGFDGLAVNEHHNTQFSMTPAASVMAATVAALTTRAKIQVAGVPINLSYPNRVAEEYAMLDVLSKGRMEFAFPLGTGMEYWSNAANINPASARARFRESLDVILKCWTEDGPMSYQGEFFTYRYLNPWPKPYQKPHPKLFIVGSGSPETVELAVEFGTGYSVVLTPIDRQLRAFARLRELAAGRGRTVQPDELIIVVPVYVADTDEEAVREARPYMEEFWHWSHRVPPKFLTPPGYITTDEFYRRASDFSLSHEQRTTWEQMIEGQRIAFGAPDTVADLIVSWAEEAGCSRFNIICEQSSMPEWMVTKNMTMFVREVIPRVRAQTARSGHAQEAVVARASTEARQTSTERAEAHA